MQERKWQAARDLVAQTLGGLAGEQKSGRLMASLGRVSFLLVLGAMLGIWLVKDADVPPNMLVVFTILAGYNFAKKTRMNVEAPSDAQMLGPPT